MFANQLIYQPLFRDISEILLEIGHPPKNIQPGLGICVKTCSMVSPNIGFIKHGVPYAHPDHHYPYLLQLFDGHEGVPPAPIESFPVTPKACCCPNDEAQCRGVSPSAQSNRGSALACSSARQTCGQTFGSWIQAMCR